MVRLSSRREKQKADEDRVIRREAREQEHKEQEGLQAEHARVEKDDARLLLYKTRVAGASELFSAAETVKSILDFFYYHPEYLKIEANRPFVQKYPSDFQEQVTYDSATEHPCVVTLDELKRDAGALQVF